MINENTPYKQAEIIRDTWPNLYRPKMKKCSKCNQLLDESLFSPSSGGKYLRPECRKCGYKLQKERKQLRKLYGNPPEGYSCPICLKTEEQLKGTGGNASIWVVDHDHKTNQFRGHICHNCNRGLGVFQDDIERMNRAIQYLSAPVIPRVLNKQNTVENEC